MTLTSVRNCSFPATSAKADASLPPPWLGPRVLAGILGVFVFTAGACRVHPHAATRAASELARAGSGRPVTEGKSPSCPALPAEAAGQSSAERAALPRMSISAALQEQRTISKNSWSS